MKPLAEWKKQFIISDFKRTHQDNMGEDYFKNSLKFYEKFINTPDLFRPTDQAILNIFRKASGLGCSLSVSRVSTMDEKLSVAKDLIDIGIMKDIKVWVDWNGKPVLYISADYLQYNGAYETFVQTGIGFSIENFVEINPDV